MLTKLIKYKLYQFKIDAITRAIHELQEEVKDLREEKREIQRKMALLDK